MGSQRSARFPGNETAIQAGPDTEQNCANSHIPCTEHSPTGPYMQQLCMPGSWAWLTRKLCKLLQTWGYVWHNQPWLWPRSCSHFLNDSISAGERHVMQETEFHRQTLPGAGLPMWLHWTLSVYSQLHNFRLQVAITTLWRQCSTSAMGEQRTKFDFSVILKLWELSAGYFDGSYNLQVKLEEKIYKRVPMTISNFCLLLCSSSEEAQIDWSFILSFS